MTSETVETPSAAMDAPGVKMVRDRFVYLPPGRSRTIAFPERGANPAAAEHAVKTDAHTSHSS